MTVIKRRRRVNYLLASESLDLLKSIVGKRITKFKRGSRYLSFSVLEARDGIKDASDLLSKSNCYPFFLSFEDGVTLVFYDDDFLDSIVIRRIDLDVDDPAFLDILESEDKTGERTRIRQSFDLSGACNIVGEVIKGISLFKLPDNFYSSPTSYDHLGECLIKFDISAYGDLIMAGGIYGDDSKSDLRITKWESLQKKATDQLACIWSYCQ